MISASGKRVGILLVNTGSSSAPETAATRRYLKQFLSDPRIIDIAAWKRWIIVNCFILPFRPKRTAHAYKAVWTDRGSPLIAISEDFRDALAKEMPEAEVAIGMAYGEPSLPTAMDALLEKGVDRIIVAPMFPQFASATTGSVLDFAYKYAAHKWNVPMLSALPPFHDDEAFLDAWGEVAKAKLGEFRPDHVILSFHGLPERQVLKSDPTGRHCLKGPNCCEADVPANRHCYRRQCIATGRALMQRLGLEADRCSVAFQSRLGRDPWLSPATDQTIADLAKKGVKRLAVLSPAFVADCLETLEEIGMGGKESFLHHGGEEFLLVPSLNSHPAWVKACAALLRQV